MSLIEVKGLRKSFGSLEVLKGVDLTLALMLTLTTLASLSPAAAENAETEPITIVNK